MTLHVKHSSRIPTQYQRLTRAHALKVALVCFALVAAFAFAWVVL